MKPFHDGMNFWQRKWMSDQLHGKHSAPPATSTYTPAPLPRERKPRKDAQVTRVLREKPDAAKAMSRLNRAVEKPNPELTQALLTFIPAAQLNNTPRQSSSPLEGLVARWSFRRIYSDEEDYIKCIELLLNAGARWNPSPDTLLTVRRRLMEHDDRYIVRVLRLLLYTPNAVDLGQFLELCRSQALERRIANVDLPLVNELKELRSSQKKLTASGVATKTETAPAVAAPPQTSAEPVEEDAPSPSPQTPSVPKFRVS